MNRPGGPLFARLDARRVHFQHGPIDLIIEACGEPAAVHAAYSRTWQRFQGMLEGLVGELPLLRTPLQRRRRARVRGPVARRMHAACWPFRDRFITPMAAVAGAVADELMAALAGDGVRKAYINNGGDIALHLSPGESFRVGVAQGLERFAGDIALDADSPVRGVATSGWRGRSFSLGIADSVTVLAASAAAADAAATMIANAVNVDDAAIARRPARELQADSDLGARRVTVAVGPLERGTVAMALDGGEAEARRLLDAGLIRGAALFLQDQLRVAGLPVAAKNVDTSKEPR
jgi:ApbE superfamily uncharacterized protein (UPF0280 family)